MFNRTNVVAGQTYCYKPEDVGLDGTSTRHGPIEAKAAPRSDLWRWWPVGVLLIASVLVSSWWLGRSHTSMHQAFLP